jgi:hypothetical protein
MERELETMERQCTLVRGQVAHLRTEVTGGSPAGTSTAASAEAQEPQ